MTAPSRSRADLFANAFSAQRDQDGEVARPNQPNLEPPADVVCRLVTEIDDAALTGDSMRRERAEAEREALIDQLASAYGLGGRARRGNDPIERARSTVTKQIHGAIARIDNQHPSLGLHLSNSVKTGRYCAYIPEHPISWDL